MLSSPIRRLTLSSVSSSVSSFLPRSRVLPALLPLGPSSKTVQYRSVTGSVSNKPGSPSFDALKANAGHEVKQAVNTVTDAIAGKNTKAHGSEAQKAHSNSSFLSDVASIRAMSESVPTGAFLFGAAGLVPYVATAFSTVFLSRQAGAASVGNSGMMDVETALALLHHVEVIQVGYGALILSFLGGIHFGFEAYNEKGNARYIISLAPVLVGWVSMLLAPQIALITQLFGFAAMWGADQRLVAMGWSPSWYATYRFWLSLVVTSSIVLTLGGAAAYSPGPVSSNTQSRLAKVHENKDGSEEIGEIHLTKGKDAFVEISNPARIKAEEEEKAKKVAEKLKEEKAKEAEKWAAGGKSEK